MFNLPTYQHFAYLCRPRSYALKRILIFLLPILLTAAPGFAQNLTNVGTEFWIAFPRNSNLGSLKIFISSEFSTSGSVTSAFPGVDQNFTVVPGVITELTVPIGISLLTDTEDKGIHITTANPVAVYGLNWANASTDAFMALPVSSLGTDYRILTYKTTVQNAGSTISVVATQDGTLLTIFNHQSNITTNINLNQGQTYTLEATVLNEDLTGSQIQSNFPVTVFGSNELSYIPQTCQFADHIIEQLWPVTSWGKNFIIVPTAGRDNSGDVIRVLANEDATVVLLNGGVVATLNTGDYYEMTLTGFNAIETTKAACVAQFALGTQCAGGSTGDPFMMLIPPREQFLTSYTIGTPAGFLYNWVNVVAPDNAIGSILEDGIPIPAGAFTPVAGTNYFGAQRSITEGSHTYTCNIPFGVFIYGWNTVNSYGYPGGGSLSPVATVSSVTLSPPAASGTLDVSTLCFTAHVEDNLLNPVAGVLVTFHISGISNMTGTAYTNALGNAEYCYARTGVIPGVDNIYAECFGFNSTSSTATWVLVPPCINPSQPGVIGSSQSGCGSFTPAPITALSPPTGQTGTLEYKWQESSTGPLSGFTDIAGSNAAGYSPGSISQTTWYRRLVRVDCMTDWIGAATTTAVEMTVTTPSIPSVTISANTLQVCTGELVTFLATGTNGGSNPHHQWKVNGMNSGTDSPQYIYAPLNGDQVNCIFISDLPCTTGNPATSGTITMIVLPLPEVTFVSCFDISTTVNAKPYKLKGGVPLGGSYSGPGVNSTTGLFTPSLAGTGIKTITYTYTNASLCSASQILNIVVHPAPPFICGDNLTDIRDNNTYPTVQLGTQCWMQENLDYGITINDLTHQTDNCIIEKYTLNSTPLTPNSFYQWDEVMCYDNTPGLQGLCPPGWHLPEEAEWTLLFNHYQGNSQAGYSLKDPYIDGFHALTSGVSYLNSIWSFQDLATIFWTSSMIDQTRAWSHGLNSVDQSVSRYAGLKSNGFSVRCLKD